MSAFICSNKTISRVAITVTNVLNGVQKNIKPTLKMVEAFAGCLKDGKYDCQSVANVLYRLNVESVNARYHEDTSTDNPDTVMLSVGDDCVLGQQIPVSELLQMWMSTRCFIYQSCEKLEEDVVLDAMEELAEKIVDAVSSNYPSVKCGSDIRNLPEYEMLEWD